MDEEELQILCSVVDWMLLSVVPLAQEFGMFSPHTQEMLNAYATMRNKVLNFSPETNPDSPTQN